jgi:hypothetical protein
MLKKQMQTAATGSMGACWRQAMLVLGKPNVATVAWIYV